MNWNGTLAVLVAYLLGALPFGYLLVKLQGGGDVRRFGSGSTGATNVTRSAGKAVGLAVLVLDVAKGYAAVWLADWWTNSDENFVAAAAVAALVGHSFPVFLGFRGGKSVATGVGVFVYLTPWAVPVAFAFWVAVMAATRYVALASITAAAVFPLATYWLYRPAPVILLAVLGGATLIILRHYSNISRLIAGTESRFSFRSK